MGRKKLVEEKPKELRPIRRANDPEARESQLINMATNLAEQQLRDGTASSQVICHYLKLGTMEKRLEMEKLKNENKLLEAKTSALESMKNTQVLYEEAIAAMKSYSGHKEEDE